MSGGSTEADADPADKHPFGTEGLHPALDAQADLIVDPADQAAADAGPGAGSAARDAKGDAGSEVDEAFVGGAAVAVDEVPAEGGLNGAEGVAVREGVGAAFGANGEALPEQGFAAATAAEQGVAVMAGADCTEGVAVAALAVGL